MAGCIRITAVSRGIFRDKIVVFALSPCSVVWDSLFGPRVFYLLQGDRRRVSIAKGVYQEGEEIPFTQICTAGNAFSFSWRWA